MATKYSLGQRIEMDLTPEICQQYLDEANYLNREINNAKVNRYAKEMTSGEFDTEKLFEGKLFYIDVDGVLISAQHRMKAAVKAKYTFRNALIVVIDRDLFNQKSVEARTPKDIALMTLKAIDPTVRKAVSNAVHAMCGQKVFLEHKRPYVSKRPESYDDNDLVEVYNQYSGHLMGILTAAPKITQGAFSALGCLIMAGKVNTAGAIELAQNLAIKPKEGNAILHWTNAFSNAINDKDTKFNTEKVYVN